MSWDLPAPGPPGRAAAEAAFAQSMRRTSSLMQLVTQAAADRIGINPTDLNCLNILSLSGPRTAGQLAQATGLTTASITGVVDRLEAAGYVRRERDASDRRRVVIHLITDSVLRDAGPVFAPMIAAWRQVAAGYSDADLELILGFQAQIVRVLSEQLGRLREPGGKPSAGPESAS